MASLSQVQTQIGAPDDSIRLLTVPTRLKGSFQAIIAAIQQTINTAWTRLTILLATSARVLPWGLCRVKINTEHATAYELSHAIVHFARLTEVS